MLAARIDADLAALVDKAIVALEFEGDRFLDVHRAVDIGVARLVVADRGDAGVLDEVGRVEIGFPFALNTPSALSALTRALMASVADGWMRPRAAEVWLMAIFFLKYPLARTLSGRGGP